MLLEPAINLARNFEKIDPDGGIYCRAARHGRYWPGLLRTKDGRWFADESAAYHAKRYDFHWREITAEMAAEWWQERCPEDLMPPELRSDLRAQLRKEAAGLAAENAPAEEPPGNPAATDSPLPPSGIQAADEMAAKETMEPVALGGPDDPVFVWAKEKDPLPPAIPRY